MEGILHELYATAGVPHMLDPNGKRVLEYTTTLTLPAGLGRGPMVGPFYGVANLSVDWTGVNDDIVNIELSNDLINWFFALNTSSNYSSNSILQVFKYFSLNRVYLGSDGIADAITATITLRP